MGYPCRSFVGKISGLMSKVYIHMLKLVISIFLSFCQDVVFMNNPVEQGFSWVLLFFFLKNNCHLKKVCTGCYSLIHYSVIKEQTHGTNVLCFVWYF